MKRIIRWLERKLSRREAVADQPSNPESAKPDEIDLGLPKELQDLVDDMSIDLVVTVPNLEIPDQPSLEDGESAGFNPYDTATMHKK